MVEKCIFKSFLANVFLTMVKLTFGYISKSKTLLADGIHCLSDMSTDVVGFIGAKISNKEPDKEHPFGHGKAEYITSIFISLFIIVLAFTIFKNSFDEIQYIDNYHILLVSIISIIVKFFVSGYLIKKGKEVNSSILITSGSESRFDVLSSIVAFVFIFLSLFGREYKILSYADTIGSIIIALLTLRIGIKLFIENFNLSLGEVDLDNDKISSIKEVVSNNKEVKNIKRVTILKYGLYRDIRIEIELSGRISLSKLYLIEKTIKKDVRTLDSSYKYIIVSASPIVKK